MFVNFESHQFCKTFLDALHKPSNRKKLLTYGIRSVGQALIQGRGANLQAILAKHGQAGLADADAPLVFNGGELASLADVVAREAPDAPYESVERMIAPPTPADFPIPRIVVTSQTSAASASHRREIQHLQRAPQIGQGHWVTSGSGGYSAIGCSGLPNALGGQTLQMPLQPYLTHPASAASTTRGIPPAETPYAFLRPQIQALPQDLAGNRLSGCVHPIPVLSKMSSYGIPGSSFGPQSFKGGCAGTAPTAPQCQTQAVLNPTNMAPVGHPEPGAESWWRIAQTPQLQETAASSLHCFGSGVPGAARVPHSASRITWDL